MINFDIKKYLIQKDENTYNDHRIVANDNIIIEFSTKKHLKYNIFKYSDDESVTITKINSDEIIYESLDSEQNYIEYMKNKYLIISNGKDLLLSCEIIKDRMNRDLKKVIHISNIFRYSSLQISKNAIIIL